MHTPEFEIDFNKRGYELSNNKPLQECLERIAQVNDMAKKHNSVNL